MATFPCYVCGTDFLTKRALQTHTSKAHGYTNPLRMRMRTSKCECCKWEFHTRLRLLEHLRKNGNRPDAPTQCHAHYINNVPLLTQAQFRKNSAEDQALRAKLLRQGLRPIHPHPAAYHSP